MDGILFMIINGLNHAKTLVCFLRHVGLYLDSGLRSIYFTFSVHICQQNFKYMHTFSFLVSSQFSMGLPMGISENSF